MSIICGTPNAYPLTEKVAAVPLDGIADAFTGA